MGTKFLAVRQGGTNMKREKLRMNYIVWHWKSKYHC